MSAPGGTRPRVFIVDDHGLFRSGVRSELGDQVDVVGEADDVAPAITLIAEYLPDVVLLDVHLPGGGGQDVVTATKATHPQVRFLALSVSDAAVEWLAEHGYEPEYGARPLRRLIQREVDDRIANLVVGEAVSDGDTVRIDVVDGALDATVAVAATV